MYDFDSLPQDVKDILITFNEDEDAYEECKRIQQELLKIRYVCTYDLSGCIDDVAPIEKLVSPRKCSATGEQMWAGYVVPDEDVYFKYEHDLVAFLRENYMPEDAAEDTAHVDEDDLLNAAYDDEVYYYTAWDELDDYGYLPDGELIIL